MDVGVSASGRLTLLEQTNHGALLPRRPRMGIAGCDAAVTSGPDGPLSVQRGDLDTEVAMPTSQPPGGDAIEMDGVTKRYDDAPVPG